ncbi:TetR/AcrR family transcriptional regulator [Paenibacillus xylanexedens]|uniref:TetR/AcrR family transcriptional regulator n=1 Tax=Paenibacillus xylanexedens TaxID=528191 RepID=UPI0011AAB5BF|nr:TetR/AcrR family transcriptional regulator [Paenibacillus xylanexedens]
MPEQVPKRLRGRPKQTDNDISMQQTIIYTASTLFKEFGYEMVTLQQIGKKCGVSKPTIYYHFAGKADLFVAAMTTMLQNVRKITSLMLHEAEHLRDGLIRLAEARLANPHGEIEMMMREAESFLEEEQIHAIREAERQIHEVLASHFRQAMDQKIFREEDPMFLAEAFSTLMLMGNREYDQQKYESHHVMAEKIVRVFLEGVTRT